MKALETRYAGYVFRSRLEARWAVFFETLRIPYRYESEGYELDGICYLPDFWLSEQDCWVEIKGQLPTEAEQEKARRLALQSGKEVYLLAGDIWLPPGYQGYCHVPPKISTSRQGKAFGKASRDIPILPKVGRVLQKLLDHDITLSVKYGYVTLHLLHSCSASTFGTQEALVALQQHADILAELAGELHEASQELLAALTPEAGWQREYSGQVMSPGFVWAECSACGEMALSVHRDLVDTAAACLHQHCRKLEPGTYRTDTPRLLAAYRAARQARFST